MSVRTISARGEDRLWWGAVGMSVAALAARGVDRWSWIVPVCGGIIGTVVPVHSVSERTRSDWVTATGLGLAAFVVTRSFWSLGGHAGRWAVAAAVVAGVAEEALFRRGLYGLLERWGAGVGIGSTAVVFALVHVPAYGWRALPVDIGAGVVFGWQRWAGGSWTSPAVTHAVANAVVYV